MVHKVAIIKEEFLTLAKKLEMNHQSIINKHEVLTKKLEEVVSESGSLYSPQFSPKVKGLADVIDTDIITRLEKLFKVTEEVIKNYEKTIANIDRSNTK